MTPSGASITLGIAPGFAARNLIIRSLASRSSSFLLKLTFCFTDTGGLSGPGTTPSAICVSRIFTRTRLAWALSVLAVHHVRRRLR